MARMPRGQPRSVLDGLEGIYEAAAAKNRAVQEYLIGTASGIGQEADKLIEKGRTVVLPPIQRALTDVGEGLISAQQEQQAVARQTIQMGARVVRRPFGGRPVMSPTTPDAPWREPLLPISVARDGTRRQVSYADYNRSYPPDLADFERRTAQKVTGKNLSEVQTDSMAHAYEVYRPLTAPRDVIVDNMPALPRPLPENGFAKPFQLPIKDGQRVNVFGLPLGLGNVRVERDATTGAYANITEPSHIFHGPRGGGYVITPVDRRYPIHASGVGNYPELNETLGPYVFAPSNQR
jgi:hypothetical protein